jgi:phosphohistidine phosphatase
MYLDVLAQMADDQACVMVVGHNPGMEELVEQVTGVYESMPTAALAQVSLPIARWGELSAETEGQLINLWRPREL